MIYLFESWVGEKACVILETNVASLDWQELKDKYLMEKYGKIDPIIEEIYDKYFIVELHEFNSIERDRWKDRAIQTDLSNFAFWLFQNYQVQSKIFERVKL